MFFLGSVSQKIYTVLLGGALDKYLPYYEWRNSNTWKISEMLIWAGGYYGLLSTAF